MHTLVDGYLCSAYGGLESFNLSFRNNFGTEQLDVYCDGDLRDDLMTREDWDRFLDAPFYFNMAGFKADAEYYFPSYDRLLELGRAGVTLTPEWYAAEEAEGSDPGDYDDQDRVYPLGAEEDE